MQKFIADVRRIAKRSEEMTPWVFFKEGQFATNRAIIRELKRRRLSDKHIKAARRFFAIVGYNKSGNQRQQPAEVFDHALKMSREGAVGVLDHIDEIARKLKNATEIFKIRNSAVRNPAIIIATEIINAKTFLDRRDTTGLLEDIANSKVSARVKERLRKYLEAK